jgi:glucose/arabinose dehydrogenase
MLVTERPGRMRIISEGGRLSDPLKALPAVKTFDAEGLNDVLLDRNFSTNRILYFTYTAPLGDGVLSVPASVYYSWADLPAGEHAANALGHYRLASARLAPDLTRLEDVKVILEGVNRRIVQTPDGKLFVNADTPAPIATSFSDEPQHLECGPRFSLMAKRTRKALP